LFSLVTKAFAQFQDGELGWNAPGVVRKTGSSCIR
jgi:hypothetical protein